MGVSDFLAGGCGGALAAAALHPLDLVKYRYQVDDKSSIRPKYRSIIRSFIDITREGGVKALYTGASANIFGNLIAWGGYFYLYEALKSHYHGENKHLFINGYLAGVGTLLLTNPLWVVKTQCCLQYSSNLKETPMSVIKRLWSQEGLTGFYRGTGPGLLNCFHGAIQFTIYDSLKLYFTQISPIFTGFTLGMLSKFIATSIMYPVQVVRSRQQDQHRSYKNVISCVKSINSEYGLRGYYRGLSLQLVRMVPQSGIIFAVYETVKLFQ